MFRYLAKLLITCCLLVGTLPSVSVAKRVALVVGNGAYQHATELPNPGNDAKGIAAALMQLGFDVDLQTDIDYQKMTAAVRRFSSRLRGADVGLFFYAGHGLQVNGQNYLAPVDARLSNQADLDFETVSLDLVLTQLEREPRTSLVFLDACRDNPLVRNLARSMGRSGAVSRGLSKASTGIGTLIAYATQPDNVAEDGHGNHSPFTAALLKHIRTPRLEVRQILTRVRRDVLNATGGNQVPWDHSSLTGDFFFVESSSVAVSSVTRKDEPAKTPAMGRPNIPSTTTAGLNSPSATNMGRVAPPSPNAGALSIPSTSTGMLSIPTPDRGQLHIQTHPEGAVVWLDGKFQGPTPLTLDGLQPGQHVLKVAKPGHKPLEQQVRVRAGFSVPVTLFLDRDLMIGSLGVESSPADAAWYFDGKFMGRTPGYVQGVKAGQHEVEIIKPGYNTWRQTVNVAEGKHLNLGARLVAEKVEYALTVETEPPDANVILVNTGYRYHAGILLPPAKYRVEVSSKGYETREELVEIAGADRVVKVKLRRLSLTRSKFGSNEWTEPITRMEFIRVPKSCYQMGSKSGKANEKPRHQVCVNEFWIGKYEVTQGQWKKIMGSNPSRFKLGDTHPVENVSWNDVQNFIEKLNARSQGGFRLPTEAEWEYACRGGSKQEKYCGSNDANLVAWYSSNSRRKTHPVGQKAANALGLHDMSANVWEWVGDWYDGKFYHKRVMSNPQGPSTGTYRVVRGGSWSDRSPYIRAGYRYYYRPGYYSSGLGFRLLYTKPLSPSPAGRTAVTKTRRNLSRPGAEEKPAPKTIDPMWP